MKRTLLIIVSILLVSQVNSFGQCCSAGNPSTFSFGDQGTLKARFLQISSAYKIGYSGTYFNGHTPIEMGFSSPASYSFMNVALACGISNKITLMADAGYFFVKKQENPAPSPPDKGNGLGDASLDVKYRLLKSMKHRIELTVHSGIRLPVGVFDQEKNGVKLPITVQPSSGSFVFLEGIACSTSLKESKWRFFSAVNLEIPHLIDSRNFYYRYGNLYNLSIATAYLLHKRFMPSVQLQAEFRDHASREDNNKVDASGYKLIFLTPQIEAELFKSWNMQVFMDLPVYRYFNGIQLANSYRAGIKLIKRFSIL